MLKIDVVHRTLIKYLKQQKDSELVLKLDDKNEITGWEVANTKTRMYSDEICQCCQAASAASNTASNAASNTASRNSYP